MINNTYSNIRCHILVFIVVLFLGFNVAADDLRCPTPKVGGYRQGIGPFDYRKATDRALFLEKVEIHHFTPKVATLESGQSSALPDPDIDYTLRAYPNHHRALQSLAELGIIRKKSYLKQMTYTIPCYFIRASRFLPDDGLINAIYAYYLANIGQKDIALMEIEQAIRKEPNNPRVAYEAGLVYFQLGDNKTAKEYAVKAKNLGSNAVGLDKLLSQPNSKAPK